MDRLIELDLVRCLGEVEAIGDIPSNLQRLKRLSFKRSLLVFDHLVKWYEMRSSTDIQRQSLYLRATFYFATNVLEYSAEPKDIASYWDFVTQTMASKGIDEYWPSVGVECIAFVKELVRIDQEAVFSFYFSFKMHFKPSRNRIWLLLAKAFVKDSDISFNERFLSRFCSKIENVHGSELKTAYCEVFTTFGNVLNLQLGRSAVSSSFSHFIETIALPKVVKLTTKVKYNEYSFATWAALVGLCSRSYFLHNMGHLLNSLQSTIYLSDSALQGILKVLWIYLNRHTEAWATMGRVVEETFKTLLAFDLRRCDASSMVEIMNVVFLKMPRIALNGIILPRIRDCSDNWEQKLMLTSAVRTCLSMYCQVSKSNAYPAKKGSLLCESKVLLYEDLHFDVLGPYDSKEFFDYFQKSLGQLLISLLHSKWNSSILDPREDTWLELNWTQSSMVKEILIFSPLPQGSNVTELCEAIIKLAFNKDYDYTFEKYLAGLNRLPLLWLECLTSALVMFLNMSEALIEKRRRVVQVIILLLGQRQSLDENINLPTSLMQKTAALLIMSGEHTEATCQIYPFDLPQPSELFDSAFEKDLFKRLLRIYYFVIGKKDIKPECFPIMESYFLFFLNSATDGNFKIKKPKRSSWSFESLSKLSMDNGHSPPELYILLTPCLEHDNQNMRHATLSILEKAPLSHVPLIINSMEETLERCSDELRNAKFKPVRNNIKSDHFKILITRWIVTMLLRFTEDTSRLEESFVHLAQKHLLEVFYFESEIDLEIALPELRLEFYRLIRSLFLLDRAFPKMGTVFPYKLQTELFSHLRAWLNCCNNLIPAAELRHHETELQSTMFALCDGLLSPPASLRGECISLNSVFSWIDEVSQRKGYQEDVEKALLALLQNGAIIDHIIDRCYKSDSSSIFRKVLEKVGKLHETEELGAKIKLALICNK